MSQGKSRCPLHPQDDAQLLTQVVPHVPYLEANLPPHVSIPRNQGRKEGRHVILQSHQKANSTLPSRTQMKDVSEFQLHLPAAGFQGGLQVGIRLVPDDSAFLREHRQAVKNSQSILCSSVTWLLGLREFVFPCMLL